MVRFARTAVVLFLALVASSCSGSVEFSFGSQTPADAAVELIESDGMAQRLMLDSITGAICEDPADEEDGTVFPCTATSGGETIEFDVTLEPEDRIFAAPTNVVAATFMGDYATAAVQALNSENGFTLPEGSMDCGTESIVLDAKREMTCQLTNPDEGVVYDAVLTVRDVNLGTFGVVIAGIAE